jgi:hypothetical protein
MLVHTANVHVYNVKARSETQSSKQALCSYNLSEHEWTKVKYSWRASGKNIKTCHHVTTCEIKTCKWCRDDLLKIFKNDNLKKKILAYTIVVIDSIDWQKVQLHDYIQMNSICAYCKINCLSDILFKTKLNFKREVRNQYADGYSYASWIILKYLLRRT